MSSNYASCFNRIDFVVIPSNIKLPLEQESRATNAWFKINKMVKNPDNFRAIAVIKNCKMKVSYHLNIKNQTINFENCVRPLDKDNWLIGNFLSFEQHISTLCKTPVINLLSWE